MGASFREVLQGWNVGTGQWLRLVAYERAARHRTVAVYALSALWHGLDPCYFMTFGVGALCTEAGRAVSRRRWRSWRPDGELTAGPGGSGVEWSSAYENW